MALVPGIRLGAYEVVSLLGEGGMGQVYRAKDTRLKRDVALKILPEAFASDPDRVARFQREAELLATLNHPNIATIYGLEHADGKRALVLELIEGPTLADRIGQGPIPLDEALVIAGQIADALEAAHERGVIHRDLKPANIKLTPDDKVKVLDFGLAKAMEPVAAVGQLTAAPTITTPAMTQMGVLLGTAAYMSPEQATGQAADRGTDVWAFGVVLFEMLTGAPLFVGDTVSHTLAYVITKEPPWSALPATTPASVRRLLRRCLQRDRKGRLQAIGDARLEIADARLSPESGSTAPTSTNVRSLIGWRVACALLALATFALSAGLYFPRHAEPVVVRFSVPAPDKTIFSTANRPGGNAVVSPDGRTLAFAARATSGGGTSAAQLWVRSADSLTARPLADTDDARMPFWSPDSRFIGYSTRTKVLKIAATGGPPQTLCDCLVGAARGGTWGSAGIIVFVRSLAASTTNTLLRVSSAGGEATPFLKNASALIEIASPSFLPDGHHILFHARELTASGAGVYVVSVEDGEWKRIATADSSAVYDVLSERLLFVRQGTLMAQRFDVKSLSVDGEPLPVAEHVDSRVFPGETAFSASNSGLLVYATTGTAVDQAVWVDRQGKFISSAALGNAVGLDLSPDGKRIASHRHDESGGDIWITDIARGTTSRLTFDPTQDNSSPVWSGDGTQIAFASRRGGKWGIFAKTADNSTPEKLLIETTSPGAPMSWSRDGRSLVYIVNDPKTGYDIWLLPLAGDRKPVPIVKTPFQDSHPQISPDGRWLAYETNETGRREIYVQPFPTGPGRVQVSTNGGTLARWRADGRELFYTRNYGGVLSAVDVLAQGSTFEVGTPRDLFDAGQTDALHEVNWNDYAVSNDGQRLLRPRPVADSATPPDPLVVVLNWLEELKQRVQTKQ